MFLSNYLCQMNSSILLPAFISFQEITVILLIAVVIFGPKKIPEIARGLGEGIRAMKKATDDIKQELMNPVEDIKDQVTKPLQDINPIKDIQDTIEGTIEDTIDTIPDPSQEIKESLDDIVGPIKRN